MKNYRILRIQGITYPGAEDIIYQSNKKLGNSSYSAQLEAILERKIVHSGGFSKAMKALGNSAYEIIFDCERLQKTWAQERGFEYSKNSWRLEIVLGQIKEIRPEILYLQDIFSLPYAVRHSIKELCPYIRLVVIQKGYPGETRDLSDADILLVSSPVLYRRYRQLKPHLVYHSFDDGILDELGAIGDGNQSEQKEFVFAGSARFPEIRYWALIKVARETELQMWLHEDEISVDKNTNAGEWSELIDKKKTIRNTVQRYGLRKLGKGLKWAIKNIGRSGLIGFYFEIGNILKSRRAIRKMGVKRNKTDGRLPVYLKDIYPQRVHPPVFGIDYYQLLSWSKVVFNIHSEKAHRTVDNMKMFEITGVGSCLLTDYGDNINDLFVPDEEIVTYSSLAEAVDKVEYLLNNAEERQKIAAAGKKRTLRDHNVLRRCEHVHEIILSRL